MIYTDKIHLVADTLEELHDFAAKIGLKREWFQDHPRHPHYDIWNMMLKKALDNGAQVTSSRNLIRIINGIDIQNRI